MGRNFETWHGAEVQVATYRNHCSDYRSVNERAARQDGVFKQATGKSGGMRKAHGWGGNKRVREWRVHSLPVIAMRLIPHIYRRASFSQRAVPWK
ncbi:MAG: hypothetical protein ABGZ24_16995, partial [Fuerstiella sp.]